MNIFKKLRTHNRKRRLCIPEYARLAYSQEGEDMVIERILGSKNNGFFIDVGAHHPSRFSNTRYFYDKGWCGINIDPLPGAMQLFNKERPRDTNIEGGIAEKDGRLTYYMFNESALNTFSEEEATKKDGLRGEYRIIEKRVIAVQRLDELLHEIGIKDKTIDFISVDAEGLDLGILKSNDWNLFRPTIVLAEALNSSMAKLITDPVVEYMDSQGFYPVAKTYNTVFFKDSRLESR